MFDDIQYRLLVRPIRDVYPGDDDGSFNRESDYDSLLASLGFVILIKVDDNGYSGDSRVLFQHGDFYGVCIFGWGSCSGCDALQGCSSWDEIEELRKQVFDSIRWGSARETLQYMREHDWEGDYSNGTETNVFREEVENLLSRRI